MDQQVGVSVGTVCDLGTEVMCVRLRSVMTVQLGGDHRRQQLSLETAERGCAVHNGLVHPDAGTEGGGIHTHDMDDVPDSPRSSYCFVELFPQRPGRFVNRYLLNPGHLPSVMLTKRHNVSVSKRARNRTAQTAGATHAPAGRGPSPPQVHVGACQGRIADTLDVVSARMRTNLGQPISSDGIANGSHVSCCPPSQLRSRSVQVPEMRT